MWRELSAVSAAAGGHSRITDLQLEYETRFGTAPTVVVSAPGRTEILGNHTDHNNGRVIAAAVQLDALFVAGPSPDNTIRLNSVGWPHEFTVDTAHSPETARSVDDDDTSRLMRGVADGLKRRDLPAPAYCAVLDSRVTPGSGLSSSAALEMGMAGIHAALSDTPIDPVIAARVGQHAENHFMNKPSGLMDQMASAHGGMIAIDFGHGDEPRIHALDYLPVDHGLELVVVNTGGSHADLTSQYAAIPDEMHAVAAALGGTVLAEFSRQDLLSQLSSVRETCGDRAVLRALHFFQEQERVMSAIDAIDRGTPESLLEIMNESGDSSWRLLQNIFPEGDPWSQPIALGLELTREFLETRGGRGAYRVHGGGFAGTMLAAMPREIASEYHTVMGRAFGDGAVQPITIRRDGLIAARLL